MNTKYFLAACFIVACQTNSAQVIDESCLTENAPVVSTSLPTPVAASLPSEVKAEVVVEVAPEPTKRAMPTPTGAELRMVSSFGEKQFIMLQENKYETLAKGKAKLLSKKNQHVVRRDVDLNLLPESTKAWMGQEVSLLQRDGTFCNAKVSGLALLGQIYLGSSDTPRSSAELFSLMQKRDGVHVVAELEPNECKDIRFARLASLPTPEVFKPAKAPQELRKTVLPLMRALPAYKAVQGRFEEYKQSVSIETKRWENYYDSKPTIGTFSTATETFVYASIQHNGGCGDFFGNLFALWRLNEDQSLSLIHFDESGVTPDAVLDLNGDGNFEFLHDSSWERLEDGTYNSGYYLNIPYEEEICSC